MTNPESAAAADLVEPAPTTVPLPLGEVEAEAAAGVDEAATSADETAASVDEAATSVDEAAPSVDEAAIAPGLPEHYLNRELSWLQFNSRVLEEARDRRHPLLERVKFLSIYGSNLDEFFMVRVAGLCRQLERGALEAPPDGMTPSEQLAGIRTHLQGERKLAYRCWHDDLLPKLQEAGIAIVSHDDLSAKKKRKLRSYFELEIFPVLTPLAFDPGHPFPHVSNLSLNLAVVIDDGSQGQRFARVKVPPLLPRLVRVPGGGRDELGMDKSSRGKFIWIEELIAANLDLLFPGFEIAAAYPFRVTRDADLEIEDDEADDLLTAIVEVVGQRHFGSVVQLEVREDMPKEIRAILEGNMGLAPFQVDTRPSPLGLADLSEIAFLDRPELRDRAIRPLRHPGLRGEESLFRAIRRRDHLLYHPYDSFSPVVRLLREAAADPKVIAIKQTLYRVGANSPVVEALMEARENGKQVSVLVELKARFDEEHNIGWARALEASGVHVVYGVMGLKTHAKMCLVVRREAGKLHSYVHLATGNYNPATARVYTDIGLLTDDVEVASDVGKLFNSITGYARDQRYSRLLVAPGRMRSALIRRIDRETEIHRRRGGGRLIFKMNSLVDRECIDALYRASQAGVEILLQVRGICCLRPGVPGLSENIAVTSIVGRFLEHSRLYYFRNDGDEELFTGSADMMPRNLNSRVELLCPILDRGLRRAVLRDILAPHLADTANCRRLESDGAYRRVEPEGGSQPFDSQRALLQSGRGWHLD